VNQYGIPDWRLEQPEFEVREITEGPEIHYEIKGKLNTPVPPIRESKYLTKEQHLELYRWMVMNRRMEQALENARRADVFPGTARDLRRKYSLDGPDWDR